MLQLAVGNRMLIARISYVVVATALVATAPAHAQNAAHNAAKARVFASCDLPSESIRASNGTTTTYSSAGWTGGCVNGRRDGFGEITSRQLSISANGVATSRQFTEEGQIVSGYRAGLWCTSSREIALGDSQVASGVGYRESGEYPFPICSLWPTSGYTSSSIIRDIDGSWLQSNDNGLRPVIRARYSDAAVRAESQRLIAARAAGTRAVLALTVQLDSATDLVADGRLQESIDRQLQSIRGARVAIVVTTRAQRELERWRSEREALAGLPEIDRYSRRTFLEESDPTNFVVSHSNTVLAAGAVPFAADDFSVLQDGRADYVLLLDFAYESRIPHSTRELRRMSLCRERAPACSDRRLLTMDSAAYLIRPDLVVVRKYRQIWPSDEGFFGSASEVITDMSMVLNSLDTSYTFFRESRGYLPEG